jgi:membrane protease YdiL (CAAX protease family)
MICGALATGSWRIAVLQRNEFGIETPARSLRALSSEAFATPKSARLGTVKLHAGQHALFELCAQNGLRAEDFAGAFELAIVQVEADQLMLRVPLDLNHLERVRRDSSGGCLLLGSGPIEKTASYKVEAVWPDAPPSAAAFDTPLRLRVLARPTLRTSDFYLVLSLGCAVCALLLAWLLRAGRPTPSRLVESSPSVASSSAIDGALALLATACVYSLTQVSSPSALSTLGKGLFLLAAQLGLGALFSMRRQHGIAHALGTWSARSVVLGVSAGFGAWPLLVVTARLALRWMPSSGEAPIQTFISWPSGMLCTALLGVILPVGEELFFRGYLYGAFLAWGRAFAALLSIVLFGLLHAEQSWGNWGGLFAVFAAGAVLCAVRVVSDSSLVSALTHVAYNLTLTLSSLWASTHAS